MSKFAMCLTSLTLTAAAFSSPTFAQGVADPTVCEFSGQWGDIEDRGVTVMLVRQDQAQFDDDDTVPVGFMNEDWSIAKGDKLGRIKVEDEQGGWFDNEAVATNHGFVIWSSFELVSNVFDGYPSGMEITGKGKVIDRLNLTGMMSEWASFKACRAKKVAVAEERKRKAKLAREIPKDPFAK